MPYTLAFGRDGEGDNGTSDPGATYDALCDGADVHGLAELSIEKIQQKFYDAFDSIIPRIDDVAWESSADMFMLEPGRKHVFVVSGHSTNTDHYNTMIDIMKEFGCPLYDPQTGTRYQL
jgi:hypothetical protein